MAFSKQAQTAFKQVILPVSGKFTAFVFLP
jgi:hypothetical protein